MDLINLDLIPRFLMPLLMKKNIEHEHANYFPTAMYLLKFNERNTSARCDICSKLTVKRVELRH